MHFLLIMNFPLRYRTLLHHKILWCNRVYGINILFKYYCDIPSQTNDFIKK